MTPEQVLILKKCVDTGIINYKAECVLPAPTFMTACVNRFFRIIHWSHGAEGLLRAENFHDYLNKLIDPLSDPVADIKLLLLLDALILEKSTGLKNSIFLQIFNYPSSQKLSEKWMDDNKGHLFKRLEKYFDVDFDIFFLVWDNLIRTDYEFPLQKLLHVLIWQQLMKKFNLHSGNRILTGQLEALEQTLKDSLIKDPDNKLSKEEFEMQFNKLLEDKSFAQSSYQV